MMKLICTLGFLLSLGVVKSYGQTNTEIQPASSSRGAVLAPGTQAVPVPADSSAVILSEQKKVAPTGSAPVEEENGSSGQPATSVRKPD